MRTYEEWMDEYGESHQNHTNQVIHKICVPLITFSVVGFLWSIPRPLAFNSLPFLNWATLLIPLSLIFYLTLNVKIFWGILLQILLMSIVSHALYSEGRLLSVCGIVFVLAWIGQFWGHRIEGKRPSFLKDLVFLMIGPAWVTRSLYAWIGIKV